MSFDGLFLFLARVTEQFTLSWKRKKAEADQPETKEENVRDAVHKEVAQDDEPAANERLAGQLFRFRMRRDKDPRNPKRPTD